MRGVLRYKIDEIVRREKQMGKYLIIPDIERLEESFELAKEYDLGFEVNDFYMPALQREPERKAAMLAKYKENALPQLLTMHGNFHDVLVFSEDDEIRRISEKRAEESICTARELGAGAVIFHSNINPALTGEAYRQRWVEANLIFWGRMCEKYPDINIYLENMFDRRPDELKELCDRMQGVSNFGIAFDYAHASLYGTDIEYWAKSLSVYIRHVHINDNDGENDLHFAVGEGVIDWKQFEELQKNYFKDATILIETNETDAQRKSLEYMCMKSTKSKN